MKRKGRKSKVAENSSNGVADRQDQNGDASERDDQEAEEPEDRRRKSGKRKSASKKLEDNAEDDAGEDSEEPEDKKKKNKRKSASKRDDYDEQSEDSEEPEDKRRKAGKNKKSSKKADDEEEDAQYEVEQVLEEKMIQGVRHYLIRWKGYEPESDTWEPESTLNCSELIAEFKAKKKKKNKSKLDLPKRGRKKTKSASSDQDQGSWDENEDFEVDRILDVYFKRNGQREFLVSWKGYPPSQNSWEPEDNMDCKDLIKKFMDKVERAKESDQRELRVKRTHTDRLTLMSDGHRGRRLSKRNSQKQRVHYYDAE